MAMQRPRARAAQQGFSMVELLVGIAVGLVLVAGLSLLFANTSQSGNELDKSIRQIENGRLAMEILGDDLALAGFYGEIPTENLTYTTPVSLATELCSAALASQGWDASTPTALKAPLPVMGLTAAQAATLPCLANYRANTPAVVVHRLSSDAVAPAAISSNTAYVQTSRCTGDPVATQFVFSATSANFTLRNIQCNAVNPVRLYVSRIYYIASCNECGFDTTPTLKMLELRGNALTVVPLVEGIEDIVFEYGFDTTDPADASATAAAGKGAPDIFRTTINTVDATARDADWGNVVAVRMHLLSRSVERSAGFNDGGRTYALGLGGTRGPFTDGFKRRAYTTTIRINNIAGQREVPPSS